MSGFNEKLQTINIYVDKNAVKYVNIYEYATCEKTVQLNINKPVKCILEIKINFNVKESLIEEPKFSAFTVLSACSLLT